ncbi:MAG TPA: MYXO-CTERM sorting domain-containing protein [Polyangia bacterium]|nr:MYXO-CTERM sorting domain-containing protein [Polyangia bacterium]
MAQTATVTLSSQKQYIRGFGGMSHAAWAGDLTAAERTLAFGNGDGQLGFTALRIPVTDGSPDSANVATAKAAIAAGAIVFATPWNAAGAMTSSQFASYANHLNNFVSYMSGQGVDLYAIGVQNEPDYGSQGGWMTWTAALCHDFVLGYGAMIATKLMSCESYSYNKSYYDPILNDSAALANVKIMGTHLYGTPVSSYPYPLFDQKGAGKERWMTEHYTDSTTDADSWPNALGVATELHHAMVDGQFNLYTWWFIVRSYGPIKPAGTVSKRGWCMAQFSKFIRPGFYRVDATATPVAGVYLSAYTSNTDVVVVVVNTNNATASLDIAINGSNISSYDRFTTSGSKSLSNDGQVTAPNGALTLSLDAESVTTLRGTGNSSTGAGGAVGTGGMIGTGGTSGSGGSTGAGGEKGTGGAGAGGAAGGAGSKGTGGAIGAGGASNSGGALGSGGTTASGGESGSGGAPEGVPGSGGVKGDTGGVTGSAGLTGSGGRENGTGGASSGSGGTPGAGAGIGQAETSSDGGCSCRVDGDRSNPGALVLLSVVSVLALVMKRRQRQIGNDRRDERASGRIKA